MYSVIQLDLALPGIKATSSQQALKIIAQQCAKKLKYPEQKLVEKLCEKENLSPSGIGDGVAIPHLKSKGISRRLIALASLDEPVDFSAMDGQPADLICVLLSPEADGPLHLRGLSRISRIMKNEQMCQKLRETKDAETMRALFHNPEGWLLAA
jgi:PTS system nitrogen regulatory IIA component